MPRTSSQNVLFVGESSGDDEHEPPGASIACRIERDLRAQGYSPSPIDNWRDCGWSIDLTVGEAALQITLASTTQEKLWMVQVTCLNDPGLVARFFGKRFVDRSGEVFQLASAIHDVLQSSGCRDIRWCLDGYPDDGESMPEPVLPKQQAS